MWQLAARSMQLAGKGFTLWTPASWIPYPDVPTTKRNSAANTFEAMPMILP